MQRHNVVIPLEDGGVEVYPLKEWLRRHPDILPDVDPGSSTSHQLRHALRRLGWEMQTTPSEVRLIKPGTDSSSKVISDILGSSEPPDDAEEADTDVLPSFSLEYQLRDFVQPVHD